MNLTQLSDQDLHTETKTLVGRERQIVTTILHHLREIERRRLFSDFGCSSLFDYAVRVLGYSEGQAQRRIQAMRLMKEIPDLEKKISEGTLNLSNIAQAQTAFNELKRQNDNQPVSSAKKIEVLSLLENMSAREGQRELLKILPLASLPKDREREVGHDQVEIKFLMDQQLKQKLEEIRSLMGPKGANCSYTELFSHMAEISLNHLNAKTFGKKRAKEESSTSSSSSSTAPRSHSLPTSTAPTASAPTAKVLKSTAPAFALPTSSVATSSVAGNDVVSVTSRYIPAKLKFAVWRRDGGQCSKCHSRRNLNLDHVVPLAHNGPTSAENLRLLCFQCNQRAAIMRFGLDLMIERSQKSRLVKSGI